MPTPEDIFRLMESVGETDDQVEQRMERKKRHDMFVSALLTQAVVKEAYCESIVTP